MLQQGEVGEVAADQGKRGLEAEEVRKLGFQGLVPEPLAADEPGSPHAGAERPGRLDRPCHDVRVQVQSEIVVVGEAGERRPVLLAGLLLLVNREKVGMPLLDDGLAADAEAPLNHRRKRRFKLHASSPSSPDTQRDGHRSAR